VLRQVRTDACQRILSVSEQEGLEPLVPTSYRRNLSQGP